MMVDSLVNYRQSPSPNSNPKSPKREPKLQYPTKSLYPKNPNHKKLPKKPAGEENKMGTNKCVSYTITQYRELLAEYNSLTSSCEVINYTLSSLDHHSISKHVV